MILLDDELRVAMVTGHTALSQVPASITEDKIIQALSKLHDALRTDFAIEKPKIAVLGLNPHAGDRGLMGNQEQETDQARSGQSARCRFTCSGSLSPGWILWIRKCQ